MQEAIASEIRDGRYNCWLTDSSETPCESHLYYADLDQVSNQILTRGLNRELSW